MLRGIFALFFRSLRGDARSVWVHLAWLFLLLVIISPCGSLRFRRTISGHPVAIFSGM